MSRKLRIIIPLHGSELQPQNINFHKYNNSLENKQKTYEKYYNRNVKTHKHLAVGTNVSVQLRPKGL